MTAAAASVAPSVSDNGLNGVSHGHVTMNMPRFHPIAVNPNTSGLPPDQMVQGQYRPYPMMEHGPPPGSPSVLAQLEQIEARLRQLEQEDAARMAARSQQLAIRKREDEEFRRITECAEAEEEVRPSELCPRYTLILLSIGITQAKEKAEAGVYGTHL